MEIDETKIAHFAKENGTKLNKIVYFGLLLSYSVKDCKI